MILMMGVAGSGKSVQGRRVADELGYPWLSTGEFLRMMISGERRKQMIAGRLLDDSEIIELADSIFHMVDVKAECILDGFPRTMPQAEWLFAQHKAGLLRITAVVHLQASEQEVARRLLARGRADDTQEAISERFKEYNEVTLPIIYDMERKGIKIYNINGERSPEEVHQEILSLLK